MQVASLIIGYAVAGLNQLRAPFFVEPVFNGAMLIVAVGLALIATRRRERASARAEAAARRAVAASDVATSSGPTRLNPR